MKTTMTALGNFIGILPDLSDLESERYFLVSFDRRGNWKCGQVCETRDDARRKRTEWFKHHRKLAKERGIK